MPAIPVGQHLAEKLHAYCRNYGVQVNCREKDLYDMLAIAEHLPIPPYGGLRDACTETFDMRDTPWPPELAAPPSEWRTTWAAYVKEHSIRWATLDDAYDALRKFSAPILGGELVNEVLDPDRWTWKA